MHLEEIKLICYIDTKEVIFILLYNKNQNLLGSAMYSDETGAFAQYTPCAMAPGEYDVFFWNIKYPDTNPMKMTATIHTAYKTLHDIKLKPNTKGEDRSGRWEKIGTYSFAGTGDEYLRFTSNGSFARVADVKFVPVQNHSSQREIIIGTSDNGFSISGKWIMSYFGDSHGYSGFHVQTNYINPGQETLSCSHTDYELVLIKKGDIICNMDNKAYELCTNSLFLILPNATHFFLNTGEKNQCEIISIFIHFLFYNKAIKSLEQSSIIKTPPPVILKNELANSMVYKLEYISDIRKKISVCHKAILAEGIINEAFIYLLSNFSKQNENVPIWLKNARAKMMKNDNFVYGIQRFVEISGKTQEHLTRYMKKYYKETPSRFINTLRIHKAKELLSQTDMNVTDIIFETGFTSASHFYKLFFEYYHTSPLRYRVH